MSNSRCRRALQLGPLGLGLWLLLFSPSLAATRLAVLEVDSPALAPVATLLEVELLKLPDTEALERANLGEILKEQKLGAAFSAEASKNRVALGKILKADVLVFLQAVEKPKPHGNLIVFETRHGLRLLVEPFEVTPNAEKDAQAILPHVKQSLERARGEIPEIAAVPPLVSTDLAFERQALGKPLAAVVEQMLLARPGVAVVELAEAKALADEAALAGEKSVSRKLPFYLLGEYRHDGYGPEARITIQLTLKRGATVLGSQTLKNIIPNEAAATLRREAAALFDKALEAKAPVTEATVEAKQLAERATLMFRLSAWTDFFELAEASLLLNPDQVELHRLFVQGVRDAIVSQRDVALDKARAAMLERGLPPDFVPMNKIEESVKRANLPLAFRALPHAEYYLTHTKIRYSQDSLGAIGVFNLGGGSEFEEANRALMVRVFKAKQANKQDDDIVLIPRYCQQWCFTTATETEKWRWKLEMAESWPSTAKSEKNFMWLQDLILHSTNAKDPLLPPALEKLQALSNPAVQQVAANIRRRLDSGGDLYRDVPVVPGPSPRPLANNPRDDKADVKFIPTGVTGLNTGEIRGWVPAGQEIDALWSESRLFFLGKKDKVGGLGVIRINAFYGRDSCCFDGRYTWAYHTAGAGKPELIIVEPSAARIETITPEQGLPPIELDDISITALGAGSVCIVGHFGGRAWIGLGAFDGATKKRSLTVIHEARERPTGQSDAAWKDPKTAFASSSAYTLTDTAGAQGTRQQRVLVYRGDTMIPLLVDPVARKVEVAPWSLNMHNMHGVLQHEGALYWIGNTKNWTVQDWRVHRLSFPSLKPEVYAATAPSFGMLFKYGEHVGAIDQQRSMWIANTWGGKFRELRTDPQDRLHMIAEGDFFQSGTFGTVAMSGTLSYKVEIPLELVPAKEAATKPAPAAPAPAEPAKNKPQGDDKPKKKKGNDKPGAGKK